MQCPWPGVEPKLLNPESSTLTMRPLRLTKNDIRFIPDIVPLHGTGEISYETAIIVHILRALFNTYPYYMASSASGQDEPNRAL